MQIGKMVFNSAGRSTGQSPSAQRMPGERVETPAFLAARAEIFRESRAYTALMEQCQNITAETDPGLFWALEVLRNTK